MTQTQPAREFAPPCPGDVLAEDFLKPLGLSQNALARAIGVPRIRVSEIGRGKRAITPDTALRLARYFGASAEFWLGMQATRDLMAARRWGAQKSKSIVAADRSKLATAGWRRGRR